MNKLYYSVLLYISLKEFDFITNLVILKRKDFYMDFKQLESFIAIAKYSSFSKASRELFLTQPTLSNHIHNLEKELSIQLFDRHGKTIELTQAGTLFREYAIELVKKRDTALFQINGLIGQYTGTIEFPYSTVPGEMVVPDIISKFVKKYPGVRFKLHHLDSQDVIEAIIDRKFSMGFVGSKPNNDFDSYSVFKDDMVFIGPKSIPLGSNKLVTEQIISLPLIVREEGSGSGNIVSKELAKRHFTYSQLNIIAVVESFSLIKKLVELGTGFAFVPRSFADEQCNNDSVIRYEIKNLNSNRQFYFISYKKSALTTLESQFKEFVQSEFNNK